MTFFLPLLVASRFGSSTANMVYAGSLPFLMANWQMNAATAGAVQSVFNLAYAISLLACSWLSDRVGPRRVFVVANWLAAASFLACALWARSFESGLPLFAILALALGGSYTPALMLVAERTPPTTRGRSVGWVLTGSSLGYFFAVAACSGLIGYVGYEATWLLLSAVPLASAMAGSFAVSGVAEAPRTVPAPGGPGLGQTLLGRDSVLLTSGYTAHCWELLGMWAWAPAFLTLSLAGQAGIAPVMLGVVIAAVLHLSGAAATLVGGAASDRWGARPVLISMAAAGALLSFSFGWTTGLAPAVVLVVAALYGFATLGDSGVLSTAMTQAVAPGHLGRMLALRSILGFGAGAISPIAVGWVLDLTNPTGLPPSNWGWAFSILGIGGLLAMLSAALLGRPSAKRP